MKTPRPCEACKRATCPEVCYPLRDWQKANKKNVCKNCPDRVPGCHSTCENYKAWKAAQEAAKQVSRLQSKGEWDAKSYEIEKQNKTAKIWRK